MGVAMNEVPSPFTATLRHILPNGEHVGRPRKRKTLSPCQWFSHTWQVGENDQFLAHKLQQG